MAQVQRPFAARGGLDLETPALAIPPGRVIACLNHEATPNGYARIEGFERYSGRTAPSDATFSILTFNTGVSAFVAGETITGFTSGATARVLAVADIQGGTFGGGNASGRLAVVPLVGNFTPGELLKVGGTTRATLVAAPVLGDYHAGALELSWLVASQTYYRNLIQPLDTVGGIRGVLIYGTRVYAFSDNGAQGGAYVATTGGWSLINLQTQIKFTGGSFQPAAGPGGAGQTLTGVTSGATAKCRYIALDSGAYTSNNAAGLYIVDTVVGVFQAGEQVRCAVGQIAGVVSSVSAVQLPVGGRYEFSVFNYYGTDGSGYGLAYGVNGVGQAFEFDGSYVAFITSGNVIDTPFKIAEHKNSLFLGFAAGSLQVSVVGSPRLWSGQQGASEIGVGSDITDLLGNTADVMLIFTTKRVYALTGNDSSDFVLSSQSAEDLDTGPKARTAQRIGTAVYLDNAGLRSVSSSQYYGGFRLGTFTSLVMKELNRKKKAGITPVGSCVVKSKSQYLLFFSDGSGISVFFGSKNPEAMLFKYPFVVSAGPVVGEIGGVERVFVGATNGYVYELNKGTSFDGAAIDAYVQFPYSNHGDPRLVKRYQHISVEFQGDYGTQLGVVTRYDFGGTEQPLSQVDNDTLASALGNAAGIAAGNITWGQVAAGSLEYFVDGQGSNMSPTFFSSSATTPAYTICGITVAFKPRGHKR